MKSSLPGELVRTVSLLLEDLGTPLALGVYLRIRHGCWDEVSEVTPDPRNYLEHQALKYAADAAACGFLRKLQGLPTTHDRRANAIRKWYEGERDCFKTNFRLEPYQRNSLFPEERVPTISDFILKIRNIVRELIGNRPSDLPEGKFGPGATCTDRGRYTTVPDKIASDPSLTRDALWCVVEWRHTAWARSFSERHGELIEVPGNRFATVPKTSKTDRSIALEPSINVFYQLAFGTQLRERLRLRARWDLNRAQDIHRQVACESSLTREFATLDLSNASDTVASSLVKLLLPHQWFIVLDSLRSKATQIDDRWVVLEKFSSMGNGFTFELETVIFAAISMAVCREAGHPGVLGRDVFVFGDDIIVPTGVAPGLKSVLSFFGFTLNEDKSFFLDEPFRESCGGDFFHGKPVRPYFLKDLPNEPQDYFALANGINRLAENVDPSGFGVVRRAWFSVLDNVPSALRSCRGPQALGDIVIHDTPDRWTWRWRSGIRYLLVVKPGRRRKVNAHAFQPAVTLASALYGIGSSHPKGWAWHATGGFIPRNGVSGYKRGWVPFS